MAEAIGDGPGGRPGKRTGPSRGQAPRQAPGQAPAQSSAQSPARKREPTRHPADSGSGRARRFAGWVERKGFALVIVLSLPVLFVVLATVVNGLTPDGRAVVGWPGADRCAVLADEHDRVACMLPTLSTLPLEFEWNWQPQAGDERLPRAAPMVLADDVAARYGYAVPAALLIILSAPIIAVGLIGLARRPWRGWLPAGVLAALVAAVAGLHFQDSHPVRLMAAEHVLWLAATDEGYPFFTRDGWDFAFATVDVVTMAAMAATAVLITLFASLSVRAGPETLTAGHLRRRADWFKTALGLGSIVLVLAVATTHGLFHWSSALMAPGSRSRSRAWRRPRRCTGASSTR